MTKILQLIYLDYKPINTIISNSKWILFFFALLIFTGSNSAIASNTDKGWVIVIDAGHGGNDHGAIGSSSSEKDITLGHCS